MSPCRPSVDPTSTAARALVRVAATLGERIRVERLRRGWTLAELGAAAGLSRSAVHAAEAGRPASLDTYIRLATALGLRPQFDLVDPRAARHRPSLGADLVHSAMGEAEAMQLRSLGFRVAVDEPYQHFQFAGRADVVAWSEAERWLLHLENRTRFPDMQDMAGSFNAKRAYLAASMAERLGIRRWQSVTHVMVALWSSEVLHAIRLRPATFRALGPDDPGAFAQWWSGVPPPHGTSTTLVVFDPMPGRRASRRRFVGLEDALSVAPRYRGYEDAVAALSRAGRAHEAADSRGR